MSALCQKQTLNRYLGNASLQRYGFTNFSPSSQMLEVASASLHGHHVHPLLLGDLKSASFKCGQKGCHSIQVD